MLPTSRPLCSNSRLLLRGSAPKTRALSFSAAKWASGAPKQNSLVTSVTSEPAMPKYNQQSYIGRFPPDAFWSSHPCHESSFRLAGRQYSTGEHRSRAPAHRPSWRRRRLFSSEEPWLRDGGAQFPLPPPARRDRPDRLGQRRSMLCRGEDTHHARRETCRSGGGSQQTARACDRCSRVSAPSTTFVPVSVRRT